MDGAPLDARLPDCILATIVNMYDDDGLPTPLWVHVVVKRASSLVTGASVTSVAFACIVLLVVVRYECFVTACLID